MTETPLQKTIPPELAGQRLDRALASMFPEYSRSRLKAWVLDGKVRVDDRVLKPRDAVAAGARVELVAEAEPAVTSLPEPIALDICYEDDALLVIDKPAGLVVHPGAGNTTGTLMNGLLHHEPALETLPRAGLIHRLDKDTSGLLLVAKTLEAHTVLTRAMAERSISRHYLAVCVGVLTGGGTVDAPIGRHPVDRMRMSVQERGRPAVTHYRVIERYRAHTYISVQLDTGRTHQIRVHFAHRRHPLVGDPLYGGRLKLPAGAGEVLVAALRSFRRQALHAAKLEFAHPVSGEPVSCDAEPPADFKALLSALEADRLAR